MLHLVALLAGCLLHPPADDPCKEARAAQYEFLRNHDAQEVEWNGNGTVRSMKLTGVFLRTGLAGFEVDRPAPPEFLEAIGPALLARGTEELRVTRIYRLQEAIVMNLDQYMRGREVKWSSVNVVLNEQTNEVTMVVAYFMPDRGLDHESRLSPDEAKAKAGTTMPAKLAELGLADAEFSFDDTPAHLRYEFEEGGSVGGVSGGALVWVFSANIKSQGWYEVMVDAATGRVVRIYPSGVNVSG